MIAIEIDVSEDLNKTHTHTYSCINKREEEALGRFAYIAHHVKRKKNDNDDDVCVYHDHHPSSLYCY